MTVADRIKERRIELKLSQTELAKRMGYSDKTSISKIEASGNSITLKKVEKVANALGVSAAYLMGWEDTHVVSHQVDYAIKNEEPTEADIIIELYKKSDKDTQAQVKRILEYEKNILKALRGK